MEPSNPKSYDPPMHTAEHILNQAMCRLFNCGRSVISHIEKKKSKCDYNLQIPLREEDILKIENEVNGVISQNLQVIDELISYQEAEKQFNLNRLPENAGEILRIVRVGDYDACPCSGTHVTNTSEIGEFKIISHSYENNLERIRFKLIKKRFFNLSNGFKF